MKRWQRKALNRLADALTHVAEDLRSAARRPARVQPLRFPTRSEQIMHETMERIGRAYLQDVRFLRGLEWPANIRVMDDAPPHIVPKLRPYVSPSPYAD